MEEAGKFLTAFYDQQPRIMEDQDTRKMRQLLPIRKNKKSNWSGLSKDKDTLWDTSKLFSCNRRDERILLATVVKIMVLTMFYTHVHSEVEEDFDDRFLPSLDVKVTIDQDHKVKYLFFSKPMASNTVLHGRTALPSESVRSTLVSDTVRRLSNTEQSLGYVERVRTVNDLTKKMINGHHQRKLIRECIHGQSLKELVSMLGRPHLEKKIRL